MKLTKYEHACMVIQKGDSLLVIDPGGFTTPLTDLDGVVGIVITHEHADHWTAEQLTRILDRNKGARIFGPAGVVVAAPDFTIETVAAGDKIEVDPFELKFFGEKHAVIHSSIPIVDNVAVLVDDTFYYAGDSYTVPGVEVGTLAVPVGAPWLKIGDVIDYVEAIKPRKSLPVHEAVLSVIGKNMANGRVEAATTRNGGEFFALDAEESLEL
jgi:L-ascorbate metabolism protein UlaG (beta-lactamase superfamily)